MSVYYDFPFVISIKQFLFLTIALQILVSIFLALLLLGVSILCKSLIQGLIGATAIFILPIVLLYSGNTILEHILFIPAVMMNNFLRDGVLISIINVCAFGVICISIYVLGYVKYCGKGRKLG